MRKPLLTDDIIAKAKRKKPSQQHAEFGYYSPYAGQEDWEEDVLDRYEEEVARYEAEFREFEEQWDEDYQGYEEGQTIRIPVEKSIVKSRRIETVKREAFRSKVNKVLFWVVVLVILFILAVIYM
ncbi:cell wall synthase accessory phosphoprotein MacP [Streptococcus cameli]